jgi:hypothetical protein
MKTVLSSRKVHFAPAVVNGSVDRLAKCQLLRGDIFLPDYPTLLSTLHVLLRMVSHCKGQKIIGLHKP